MALIKGRIDWLHGGDESDDDVLGYSSDGVEESRTQRVAKRRKLAVSSSHEDSSDFDDTLQNEHSEDETTSILSACESDIPNTCNPKNTLGLQRKAESSNSTSCSKLKSNSKSKTGVVYLSRIPPFMKPQAVKSFLSPYGEIGRVFLTPEDSSVYSKRVKSGGNKKRSFVDGWVEFIHKRHAKLVAESLNAQSIGGKKGSWYHDDVWNIKYLKGFKWHHLTEQIANENAERAARLREDIAQSTKENKRFIENVEKAKMLEGMEAKRDMRRERMTANAKVGGGIPVPQTSASLETAKGFARDFKQHKVQNDSAASSRKSAEADTVRRVLSKMV